jgi:Protein of unknown function (DUF3298).
MKQLRYFTTLAILSAVLLSACGDKSEPSSDFEPVTVEKTVNIDNSKDAPQCHVHLEVLQAKNATSEAGRLINESIVSKIFDMEELSIQAAADSFANTYTRDYRKNMAPLYSEDRSDASKHNWYEYRYTVTTEALDGGDDIINYLITLDYYEGGAHGITQLLTMNFDRKTGHQLKLSDIFGTDYERSLCEKLLQALFDRTGENSIEALHLRGYLYSMDMFIPENYIITDDKVTFIFNPYEIAPYSEGRIELDIRR